MSKKATVKILAIVVALVGVVAPASASADFGITNVDLRFTDRDGSPTTQAGEHPFALETSFRVNFTGSIFNAVPEGKIRDAIFDQVAGFVGSATTVPRCKSADFFTTEGITTACPPDTTIGVSATSVIIPLAHAPAPVHNLIPPPGAAARLGWFVLGVPVIIDVTVSDSPPYNLRAASLYTSQAATVYGTILQLWGVPADPAHDFVRGECAITGTSGNPLAVANAETGRINFNEGGPTCAANADPAAFLTSPRDCSGPLATFYMTRSWQEPGKWLSGSVFTHDEGGNPQRFTGCGRLGFSPAVKSLPTTEFAGNASGLDFDIEFADKGLENPDGLAQSDIKKAVITLPEGITVNPSVGEGLSVCTPSDLDRETLSSLPGDGCPESSKIGVVSVETPLVTETIGGSVFLAEQDDPATDRRGAENPFDSLLAFYIVLRNPSLGVLVKVPAKVEPDDRTGQLVTTVDDIPQLPFSKFRFHFREGQRATLVTPSTCGTYSTVSRLTPRANPSDVLTAVSNFEITKGVNGGPCPPDGAPPFSPHFEAGSINNNAGAYSPFNMRLVRRDGEQDMTKFGSVLPRGVLGSLAGVAKCPDVNLAIARTKTGREEQAAPSCPPNSQIGRTLAGAGVGSALTYVPGSIYLAGPYKGAPLSVVSMTPAVAGPFDAGNVVVRIALDLDPITAEVEVDGISSDPIPHILKGIPLKVRDLRVYVDRSGFILNPTNCDESSARATLFGAFLDLFSDADDIPVTLATRYQAASCQSLGFKPRLKLRLRGGTRRGAHPALRAVYRARPGDANVGRAVVTLPRSAFLDQAHIRTICTRVQFAADACPAGARYGFAKAWTPLLDEPIQGPVYLRSSNNKLPDLVADLQGIVDVEVVGRIDSFGGGIRSTFATIPDAPVSRFVLRMQGGKKGLVVNSRNLCARRSRAKVRLTAQNGKLRNLAPVVRASCNKAKKTKRSSHR